MPEEHEKAIAAYSNRACSNESSLNQDLAKGTLPRPQPRLQPSQTNLTKQNMRQPTAATAANNLPKKEQRHQQCSPRRWKALETRERPRTKPKSETVRGSRRVRAQIGLQIYIHGSTLRMCTTQLRTSPLINSCAYADTQTCAHAHTQTQVHTRTHMHKHPRSLTHTHFSNHASTTGPKVKCLDAVKQ